MAGVFFVEAEGGGGGAQGVEVCEEGVEEGGGGGAAEEEGAFGVFDGEGEGGCVVAFGACGFGFSGIGGVSWGVGIGEEGEGTFVGAL